VIHVRGIRDDAEGEFGDPKTGAGRRILTFTQRSCKAETPAFNGGFAVPPRGFEPRFPP
jgi:hypothetical protein